GQDGLAARRRVDGVGQLLAGGVLQEVADRPGKLRDSPEQQATVIRTALMAAADRDPAAYVEVLPRS
ncbi:hypothetical protein AB0L17_38500, partial [Streptomyces cellulosae]